MKAWRVKLGGRDPVLRFHRVNPQTEAIERGPKASNQQDRTKGAFLLCILIMMHSSHFTNIKYKSPLSSMAAPF